MSSDGESLTGLWFEGQKYACSTITGPVTRDDQLAVFFDTRRWLEIYFQGYNPGFLPRLQLSGSDFRQQVGRIMLSIPYGQTMTYGEIARQVAQLQNRSCISAQAVGGAVGHNPISIIVPCHRVVGANGSLTGYAGGIGLKVHLLTLEGIDISRFTIPAQGTAI